MRYLDLDKLVIAEEEILDVRHYIQKVDVESEYTLSKMRSILMPICENMAQGLDTKDAAKVHSFTFELRPLEKIDEDEFESWVNICLACFIAAFDKNAPRQRERRLDVPEYLKPRLNCSLSLAKRAVNNQMIIDRFNIFINCEDLRFELVGDSDED